jgi:hypothetical protein
MARRIEHAWSWLRRGLSAVVPAVLVGALVVAFASSGVVGAAPNRQGDLDGARERWKQLTPEQRAELQRRFEHFKRLGEDERARLRGRFEHLGLVKRRAVEELPEDVRRDLEALAPPARGEVLREVAAERLSEHVRDVLELMPPHVRTEYEAATADERRQLVRNFARQLNERARHELLRLGRELQLDPARVEALSKLEPHELGREVLKLKRESLERMVAERGLPPFVSAEQWAELRSLQGPDFFHRWGALHGGRAPHERSHLELGPKGEPEGGREGGRELGAERRPGAGAPQGAHGGGPPGGRDGAGAPRNERGAEARDRSPRAERLRAMRDAVRPDPAWFVELSRVDHEERRKVIGERLRERALKFLAGAPELVAPEQLEQLRREHGGRFHEVLKRLLPDLGEPPVLRGGPERGPPRLDRPDGGGPPPAGRPAPGAAPRGPSDGAPPGGAPKKGPAPSGGGRRGGTVRSAS